MTPRTTAAPTALIAALALLQGCAATVDSRGRDGGSDAAAQGDASSAADAPAGDATGPADAPSGPCRLRALPRVPLVALPQRRSRFVAAVPTGDGAWAAWREAPMGPGEDELRVGRVDEDGRVVGGSGPLLMSRSDASVGVSMDWDAARGVLAFVAEGVSEQGSCVWGARAPSGSWRLTALDLSAPMPGFSRAGCFALLRSGAGYDFLTQQVRALWGLDMIRTSLEGAPTAAYTLPMTGGPALLVTRVAHPGGGFIASWGEGTRERFARRVQRFSDAGEALGPRLELAPDGPPEVPVVLVPHGEGILALWSGSAAEREPATLYARSLTRDGGLAGEALTPRPGPPFLGALSAALRGDDVLVTAMELDPLSRLRVHVLDRRGALRETLDTGLVNPDGPYRGAQVVATPRGALVFSTVEHVSGGVAVAVPLRCR